MYRAPRPPPRRIHGVSLLELTVTLAIAALLCGIALPLLTQPLQEMRAGILRRQLHASLSSARATAITQRQRVGVCPSEDGRRCGGRWDQGWLMFHAGKGNDGPAGPDQMLRHEQRSAHQGLLARGTRGRPILYFGADGRSGNSNQTVTVCLNGRTHGRIIVNIAGRVRSQRARAPAPC